MIQFVLPTEYQEAKLMNEKTQIKKKREPILNSDDKDFYSRNQTNIDNLTTTFIKRLQLTRKSKGLTQEEFADKVGLSQAAIRKYEQGHSLSNSNFTLKELATALGVSADYLLDINLNTDSDLDDITKEYGLREEALNVLKALYKNDGGEIQHGNIDFLNCFLGNGDATMKFITTYARLTRQKYKSSAKSQQEDISSEMTKLINEYMDKVVLPSYKELYETGTYTVHPLEKYLYEDD